MNRLPSPGDGGTPVEGMLNDLVFFMGDRSRLSIEDEEGYRFEGDIGVGGAIKSGSIGSSGGEIGVANPPALAWTSSAASLSASDDGRDESSEDNDQIESERMRGD